MPHALQAPARRRAGLALLLAASFAACARNPVTGRRELSLVSEEQEIQMGREGAQAAEAQFGLVNDQALQSYVHQIGTALAARSERPGLPWQFRVVDDPQPNAFALPGGFIYVTRGLLSLMENEAELASVLGHEIGHVTARHSASQMSRAQIAQLGLGIGSILSPTVAQFGQLAGTGLQLLFLKYGRDDERQSDELGFKYALEQGYDVREMGDVFASLQRASQLAKASPLPTWLASHPGEEERIANVQKRVAALTVNPATLRDNEAQFNQRINGLVYGENPRNGFFENGRFYHPDLRFQFSLPQGWQAQNTSQAVIAGSPEQDAIMQLTLSPVKGATAAARAFLGQQGIQPGQSSSQTVNGIPAAVAYFQAQTEQGAIAGLAVFLDHGGQTYQLLGYSPGQRFGAYDQTFRSVASSFAALTDQRALNVQPRRINIVNLPQPMTLAQFNQRYPSAIPLEELALVNQVEPNGTLQGSGKQVK